MPSLRLTTCGPESIAHGDALRAVCGYARARRWLFVRTPTHPTGHWVQVPAYPFGVYDAQPADTDPGSLLLSVLAAEGLCGPDRSADRWGFAREVHRLLPLVDRAVTAADGRSFGQLPVEGLDNGPVVKLLDAAGSLSDADRAAAVLHHHRPELFPLLTATSGRMVHSVAAARSRTPWAVIYEDLTSNESVFGQLETDVERQLGVRLTRLRLHDLLTWLVVTRRWADAVTAGAAQPER